MAPEHHGDADPNAPPAPPTPLQAWEQRMQRAQALWQNGEQEFALAQLVQAIPLAHQLLRSPYLTVQPDDYLAAWVVTHLWIAELLAERQQLPAALDYLCDAHTALLGLGHSTEVTLLQQAAWRHQRETVQALLQWQRQHGPSARVTQLLQATHCAPPAAPPPTAQATAALQPEPLERCPLPADRLH